MPGIYEAISDPSRRDILALLSGQSLPAGQIARRFPQQRPAISKHLTVLKNAGILIEARCKQQRLYSLRPGALDPLVAWLQGLAPTPAGKPRAGPKKPASKPRSTASRPSAPTFDLEFD